MSEAMSSGDIEDVLSSIRRLVSDDVRPVTKTAANAKHGSAAKGGKLLLTPALRVVSSTDQLPKFVSTRTPPAKPKIDEDVLPEDEAPFVEVLDDDFGRVVDFAAEPSLNPSVRRSTERFEDRAAFADTEEDKDWLRETQAEDDLCHGGREAAPDLTRVVSDIAAGFSDTEGDWEPETGDSPVSDSAWGVPTWGDMAPLGSQTSAEALAEEAAFAEILAQASRRKDADAPRPSVAAEEAGGHFDEAELRDLVRDLIREELSGALGERITRNVRKLVRTEVSRALSARGLE